MCPYGRFQSVLMDENSKTVTYDYNRGEPRGKKSDPNAGDCVDCFKCVSVCPTGIDIRRGQQLECIACTRCIDACDEIMTKLNRPKGLIRYASINDLKKIPSKLLSPRVFGYGILLLVIIVGATIAIVATDIKRVLAYSTISQLAYIVLAATLANSLSLAAGGLLIAAHALAKITLFFCAGMILVSLHKTTVSELDGIGHRMPITISAWFVASLCIIGLPLTGGFWSKWYLAQGALEAGQPLMLAVILLGSLLAMGYLIPPVIRAFFRAPPQAADADTDPDVDHGIEHGIHGASSHATAEAPRPALLALVCTATLSVLLFFAVQPMLEFLSGFTS